MPSIPATAHNTNSSIVISTSVGFRFLEADNYNEAIKDLRADISTSLADLVSVETASLKRIEKSADRTHAWLRDAVDGMTDREHLSLFASIPPLEPEQLSLYASDLGDEFAEDISGLCIYSPATMLALGNLRDRPIICLSNPATPQELLPAIGAGVDLVTVPFVTQSAEHGIALSFSFPGSMETKNQSLGVDLWSTEHATDLSPLSADCKCYSCQRHHRAFVHHLLQANEMLGWTLLQLHNYSIIDSFFDSVRLSIDRGTFGDDVRTFGRAYESEMPRRTGQGPRVRGYQMKSVGRGESKKNAKAYGRLDDQMEKLAEAESGIATPDGDTDDLVEHGLAKKVE